MSGFWLTPAAPGTIAPAHLDTVLELHGTVRDWIERSAVAQRNEHLRANLPYVDLMFAFGLATLGDHPTANKLVEDARKVMEGPAPPQRDPQKDPDPALVELVRRFLLKALRSRIAQAIEGKPHTGPLSEEVRTELDEISTIADRPPINNRHGLARYCIDRFRGQVRILEPSERIDVYAGWTKHSKVPKRESPETPKKELPQCVPAEARIELANPNCPLEPMDYTALAQAYVLSLVTGASTGLDGITELFSLLQPTKITNSFTTAQHFSRLHLQLVDETVLAVCRLCVENAVPAIGSH